MGRDHEGADLERQLRAERAELHRGSVLGVLFAVLASGRARRQCVGRMLTAACRDWDACGPHRAGSFDLAGSLLDFAGSRLARVCHPCRNPGPEPVRPEDAAAGTEHQGHGHPVVADDHHRQRGDVHDHRYEHRQHQAVFGDGTAGVAACGRTLGTLGAGDEKTYTCTDTKVTKGFTMAVPATGVSPANHKVSTTDHAKVVVEPKPAQIGHISIRKGPAHQTVVTRIVQTKTANGAETTVSFGTAVFTITVKNKGSMALHGITVDDALTPSCDRSFSALAPAPRRATPARPSL